ncbi:MAG: hypothetical protein ABI720_05560 [Actinomycetes bacterium]
MVTAGFFGSGGFAPMAQRAAEARTSDIGPGLLAFGIVVLLAIATFLLLRSMMQHIRKVPPTFDNEQADDQSGDDVR